MFIFIKNRQISAFEELNVQAAVEADRGGEESVRQVSPQIQNPI